MYYQKSLSVKKSKEKDFEYDLFANSQNFEDDASTLKIGEPHIVYNFISKDGTLKSGYGFKDIAMPTSETNLDDEVVIKLRGNEIKKIWQLKWYSDGEDRNKYYLFYFNDEAKVCYDNIFNTRFASFILNTSFTQTPYVAYYRYDMEDAILLSGEGGNLTIISAGEMYTNENAPRIISCCRHYGRLFAITAKERGTLVYNEDPDVLNWADDKTKDLDFSDERGDLNRIISFNDYLFIFRDFGITKISIYGSEEEFEINHIYKSDSHIYPNSIAQSGENIYFLEGNKIKVFNGSTVKNVNIDCLSVLDGCDNRYAYGECFCGKYYLACRGNFKEGKVGCEMSEGGYKNNLLVVLDIISNHIDIVRGVDINELLALNNKFKSKLIACFNNEYKNRIGELTQDGMIFGTKLGAYWESGVTDFNEHGKLKRVKSFLIKSANDCKITITSERTSKTFSLKGKASIQNIRANVLGKQFVVKIEGGNSEYISNFVLKVSCGE